MIVLHKATSVLPELKEEMEGRGEMVKDAFTIADYIYEWSTGYLDAPTGLAIKERKTTKRDKVKIHMLVQSHENLSRDMARMINSYQMIHSGLDSLLKCIKFLSLVLQEK